MHTGHAALLLEHRRALYKMPSQSHQQLMQVTVGTEREFVRQESNTLDSQTRLCPPAKL